MFIYGICVYSLDLQSIHAHKAKHLPTALTHSKVQRVLARLTGVHRLMVNLIYDNNLRLMECLRLRVKDIDFELHRVTV